MAATTTTPTTSATGAGRASCQDCPSYVPPNASGDISFGAGVGYCATRGIPIGNQNLSAAQVGQVANQIAASCPIYGEKYTGPADKYPPVGQVGSVSVAIMPRDSSQPTPSNCSECVHHVRASRVAKDHGWSQSLCLARGSLIPARNLAKEPRTCSFGVRSGASGTSMLASIDDFSPLPAFIPVDVSGKAAHNSHVFEDPRDFQGLDPFTGIPIPVSDEDKAMGIRAWRAIYPPGYDPDPNKAAEQKNPIYLPVMDPEFFDEDERAKIPQYPDSNYKPWLYVDHQDLLWWVGMNIQGTNTTPCLIGEAGLGKTELFAYMAWLCQMPFDRISITATSEVTDILGKWTVETDPDTGQSVTVWVNGRLPNRWQTPGVLCIDEPNVGPDEIWQAIRPMMDGASQLVLDIGKGNSVERHPLMMFGLAMNPSWIPTYIGTREINEADGNRMGAIEVFLPPEDVERQIIVARCNDEGHAITNAQLDTIMQLSGEVRKMIDSGSVQVSWGIRVTNRIASYLPYCTLHQAIHMAVLGRLDPVIRRPIETILKAYEDK